MNCIICKNGTEVIDKRTSEDNITRRRRQCLKCGVRFSTKETLIEKKEKINVNEMSMLKKIDKHCENKIKEKKVIIEKIPLTPEKENLIKLFRGKK